MAEDDVSVPGSKLGAVEKCKDRLYKLFGVTTHKWFIALQNDGPCTFRLKAAGSSSQESLEKAKVFLEAVIGDELKVRSTYLNFRQQEFDMVCKHYDQIECISQAYLEFHPSCQVLIQGRETNINIARELIGQILTADIELAEEDRPGALSSNSRNGQVYNERRSQPDYGRSMGQTGLGAANDLCQRGVAVMSRVSVSSLQEDSAVGDSRSESSQSSRSTSPESDFDIVKITSDPNYTAKLEKALKLGYSEEQLLQALRMLGINADQNQVLSEMIKLGSASKVSQDEVKVTSEIMSRADRSDQLMRSRSPQNDGSNLRDIIIDGSNVAMSHGKDVFSCEGIKLAVDWFRDRGHQRVTVFVPTWRKETPRPDAPITDQEILFQLNKEGIVSFTPSRRIDGKRMVCYDDRYVLNLAVDVDGIVVSNDNYRDLVNEKPEFKKVVEERLLMYTFAANRFMPPDDPLGRRGPTLDNFLCKEPTVPEPLPPDCPYGKKCTYGNKCRYHHPERKNQPHQSTSDKLREKARQTMQERANKQSEAEKKKLRDPGKKGIKKQPLSRTQSVVPTGLPDELISPRKLDPVKISETIKDERHDYNEKLNKARQILEQEERKHKSLSNVDDVDVSHLSIETRTQDRRGPATKDNQLQVPLARPKEELVSGHLLLAKKLSDEDSKFFRSEDDGKDGVSGSSFSTPQTLKPVSHLPTSGMADFMPHPKRDVRKVIAGRGLSPRHTPHETGVCISGPSGLMRPQSMIAPYDYVEQFHSYPLPQKNFMPQQAKKPELGMPQFHGDGMLEHSFIDRYPSAPGSGGHMSLAPKIHRQNSSSDSQLHMLANEGRRYGQNIFEYPDTENGRQELMHSAKAGYFPNTGQMNSEVYYSAPISQYGWANSTNNLQAMPRYHSADERYSPAGQERHYPVSPLPTHHGQSFSTRPAMQTPLYHHHPQMPMPRVLGAADGLSYPSPMSAPVSAMQQYAQDASIEPTDDRYTLYYNLCSLFQKDKVLAVMNRYPEERDPRILCSYILSLGERLK